MIKIANRVSGKTIVVKNAIDVNNYRLTHSGPIDITLIKSIKLDQTLKLPSGDKPAWVNKGKYNFVSFARNKDIIK